MVYNLDFRSYGESKVYRSRGSAEAAKRGAVASIISSLTQMSIGSPHTGSQKLSDDDVWIPAAAIAVEDAALMGRMQARGQSAAVAGVW